MQFFIHMGLHKVEMKIHYATISVETCNKVSWIQVDC